jgi:hypothetical protein
MKMAFSTKTVREQVIKRLQAGLTQYGFEYDKKGPPNQRQFRAARPFGRWVFRTPIGKRLSFSIGAGVGIRFDALENLVYEDENPEWASLTQSLGGDLGYLSEGPPPVGRQAFWEVCEPEWYKTVCEIVDPKYHGRVYSVSQVEDLDAVCQSILDTFTRFGLPFLEKYSVMVNALELLSRDDAAARLCHAHEAERAKRAIGLAFLLGNPAQFRRVAEAKAALLRAQTEAGDDPRWHEAQLQSFLRFRKKLEHQLAKPTLLETGEVLLGGLKERFGGWLAGLRNTEINVRVSLGEPERVSSPVPSPGIFTKAHPLLPSSGPLYASIAIVGKATPPLWFYEKWTRVADALDPIVAAIGHEVGVRTTQDDQNRKDVRFGKLGWDEKSHRKWTHNSPDTAPASEGWRFMLGEIWAPRWTVCERAHREPELFISFENPHLLAPPKPGQYNQLFHLALPIRFFKAHEAMATTAVMRTAQELDAVLLVMRIVPFLASGDSIQDALNNHLRYIGMEDDMVPDLTRIPGQWMPYDPKRIWSVQQ